jgi:hypothetical protein
MADKQEQRERLLAKRVRALAAVQLTRREDIEVEEADPEAGLDLMARLRNGKGGGLRQFGVGVRGVLESVNGEDADKALQRFVREAQKSGPFPYPVCLLLFTMEGSQGWFTWLAEPVVVDGRASLRTRRDASCQPLDRAVLDDLVKAVNRWYECYFAGVVVPPAQEGRKPGRK